MADEGERRVRFHGRVQFKTIRHYADFSDDEIQEGWYQKEDFARMSDEVGEIAKLVGEGVDTHNGEKIWIRGLEHLVEEEVADYRAEKMIASIDAVLDEQDEQRDDDANDPEAIAKIYTEIVTPLLREAYLIGLKDAEYAQEALELMDDWVPEVHSLSRVSSSSLIDVSSSSLIEDEKSESSLETPPSPPPEVAPEASPSVHEIRSKTPSAPKEKVSKQSAPEAALSSKEKSSSKQQTSETTTSSKAKVSKRQPSEAAPAPKVKASKIPPSSSKEKTSKEAPADMAPSKRDKVELTPSPKDKGSRTPTTPESAPTPTEKGWRTMTFTEPAITSNDKVTVKPKKKKEKSASSDKLKPIKMVTTVKVATTSKPPSIQAKPFKYIPPKPYPLHPSASEEGEELLNFDDEPESRSPKKAMSKEERKAAAEARKSRDRTGKASEMSPLVRRRDGSFAFRNKGQEDQIAAQKKERRDAVKDSLFKFLDSL